MGLALFERFSEMSQCFRAKVHVLHSVSVTLMAYLLYCSFFKRGALRMHSLSKCFKIYLFTHVICSILTVPFNIYNVVEWIIVPPDKGYDPYVLFYLGITATMYFETISLCGLFLTLDRLFMLRFPVYYNKWLRQWFPWITVGSIFTVCAVLILLVLRGLPLDLDITSKCRGYACVLYKNSATEAYYAKHFIGILNITCTSYFLYSLKVNNVDGMKNRVVKITMMTEVMLNVLPNIVSTVVYLAFNVLLGNYTGQCLTLFSYLDPVVCGIYYFRTLLRRKSNRVSIIGKTVYNSSKINHTFTTHS
ncbi:hypothetical protein Ddc_12695 [Ditylenchus destructor]|nr:hypothetical protein Ddc_12695 [Ditylenchus destructor]